MHVYVAQGMLGRLAVRPAQDMHMKRHLAYLSSFARVQLLCSVMSIKQGMLSAPAFLGPGSKCERAAGLGWANMATKARYVHVMCCVVLLGASFAPV
jgi:hypothetical protein